MLRSWIIALLTLCICGVSQAAEPASAPSGLAGPAAEPQGSVAQAPSGGEFARNLYEQVKPSLVAVKYTWDAELGSHELTAAGMVVRDDGLVMIPLTIVNPFIPDAQMKDFKIIVPSETEDETELDAVFVGRDERSSVAFVKTKEPQHWKAIQFVDEPLNVGDPVYSIGILPKSAGYKPYYESATVGANLRGEIPQVMVGGGLCGVGSPVFDGQGRAVGYVHMQGGQEYMLDDSRGNGEMTSVLNPPKFFVPTRQFNQSISDPPVAGEPLKMPWLGIPLGRMTGLDKDTAEFFGLKNKPAAQVGDVVPGSPADKAGLKPDNIIVSMNGEPLERGDLPEEIPQILARKISRMKVGDVVTFGVISEKGQPPRPVKVTLEERPKSYYQADRYYAKDLGFIAREPVFIDLYYRKLPLTTKGVVIDNLKEQGPAANAHLARNDFVTQLNGKPVQSLEQFKTDYQQFRKDKPKEAVVLQVRRGSREDTINIQPPQSAELGPAETPGAGGQ